MKKGSNQKKAGGNWCSWKRSEIDNNSQLCMKEYLKLKYNFFKVINTYHLNTSIKPVVKLKVVHCQCQNPHLKSICI